MICRFGADTIGLIEEAVEASGTTSRVVNIACSSFGQRMRFGALLFLLAEEDSTTDSAASTYFALRRALTVGHGAEPTILVLENAQWLDADSASLLCQLATYGDIRIIATSPRGDVLCDELIALIANGTLKRLDVGSLNESSVLPWLESHLLGSVSDFLVRHYWKMTGGNVGKLRRLVEQDLADRRLVMEGSVWVMTKSTNRSAVLGIYAQEPTLGLSPAAKAIWERMIRSGHPLLHMPTPSEDEARGLDELCLARLVETISPDCYAMAGHNIDRALLPQPAHYNEQRLNDLDLQLSILAVDVMDGLHEGATAKIESLFDKDMLRLIETEGADSLFPLAMEICLASTFTGSDTAACTKFIKRLAREAGHATTCNDEFLQQLSVVGLALDLEAGEISGLGHLIPNDYEASDLVDRIPWKSESTRLLASIVVAEAWMLNGRASQAQALLLWAQEEYARLDDSSPDLRLRLLAARMERMIVLLPLVGGKQTEPIGNANDSPTLEPATVSTALFTAFGRAAFSTFAGEFTDALRWLQPALAQSRHLGNDSERHLLESFIGYCETGLGAKSVQRWDHTLPPQETLSISTWTSSFMLLLSETISKPIEADASHFRRLADICRKAGYRGLELHSLGAAVAFGDKMAVDQLIACHTKVDGPISQILGDLAHAVKVMNFDAEIVARCAMVGHGMRFYADSILGNESRMNTMAKRKLQRVMGRLHLAHVALRDVSHDGSSRDAGGSEGYPEADWMEQLTKREKVIALLAADGTRNGDIARRCGISIRTVEGHLYQIHAKLNLSSRQELVQLGRGDAR